MKKNIFKFTLCLFFVSFTIKTINAQLLLEENFNFTGLLSDNGWTVHDAAAGVNAIGTSPTSLSYTDYASSGIGNMALVDTSGEDINRSFSQVDTGALYISFLINIEKAKTSGDYFFHISRSTLSTMYFRARVYTKYDTATDKIAFGVSISSNTPSYTNFSYDLNTTYLIVLKYAFINGDDDIVNLFINPVIDGTEPTPDLSNTTLGGDIGHAGTIALRQGNLNNAPRLNIDGIRVGKKWHDILPVASSINSGILENYIVTNFGTDIFTESNAFNGANLGEFFASDVHKLIGAQLISWEDHPSDEIIAARMFYRIYEQTAIPPSFGYINLPWSQNLPNNNDKLWENLTENINTLSGLTTGNYYFETYFEVDYLENSNPGIHKDDNNGLNYIATFEFTDIYCSIDLGLDLFLCHSDSITIDAGLEPTILYEEGLRGSLPASWTMYNDGGQAIEQSGDGGYLLLDTDADWVITESYDLTALQQVELFVDIASYGSGTHNLMIIEVSDDNGVSWNTAQFPFVTDTTTGNTYTTQGPFPVSASGAQVKFRFKRPAPSGRGIRFRDFKITTSAPYSSYQWSTGANTQTITVADPGAYWVNVITNSGCVARDTIEVNFFNIPVIDFGPDTAICVGYSLNLDAGSTFDSYLWSDLSTGQTLQISQAGTYWVMAVDSATGCISTDTISVIVNPLPFVDLGIDKEICDYDSITLNAGSGINYSYTWGIVGQPTIIDSTQTITVSGAAHYYVIVDNGCLDTASDTVLVSVAPSPVVDLGADKSVCGSNTTIFDAGVFDSYFWNTGDTTQLITAGTAGDYSVTVTNIHGCIASDTVNLVVLPQPSVSIGNDTIICIYDNILLNAGAGFTYYLWFNNSNDSTLLFEGSIFSLGTHSVHVMVSDSNNCLAMDTITIIVDPCTGINENAYDDIVIYPNPTQDYIYVILEKEFKAPIHLNLYNIEGKNIYSEIVNNPSTHKIDMTRNAKGIYLIKINNDDGLNVSYRIIYN